MADRDTHSDEPTPTGKYKKENNRSTVESEQSEKKHSGDKKSGDSNKVKFQRALQLQTKPDGYNSGRQYIIQAHTDEECQQIYNELTKLSKIALDKYLAKSRFEKAQECSSPSVPHPPFPIAILSPPISVPLPLSLNLFSILPPWHTPSLSLASQLPPSPHPHPPPPTPPPPHHHHRHHGRQGRQNR